MFSAEQNLEKAFLEPDFLVVTGSRLYGTARYDEAGNCISDTDLRGWTLPPWQYLLNNPARNGFEERQIAVPPDGDHTVCVLRKFLANLIKLDAQSFELFFAPKEFIKRCSPLAQELLSMRDMFCTKAFYWRITGYGNSEWRKARAVRVDIEQPPKGLDQIKADIRNIINPSKANMDQIDYLLTENLKRVETPSLHGINGKRRDEYAKYGYCTSSACHSIRLLTQCRELLDTGFITFPHPQAALLKDIKQGKMKIEDIAPIYEEAKAKADEAFATSKLPPEIDDAKIWAWYEKLTQQVMKGDPMFMEPWKKMFEMQGQPSAADIAKREGAG